MFALTVLGPSGNPGVVQVAAFYLVAMGSLVSGFMALPRRAKQIVGAVVIAIVLGSLAVNAQTIESQVPGFECCTFWLEVFFLCLTPGYWC